MAGVRAVEVTLDHSRHEVNLIVRRPVWLNLRLGRTQNALWFGRASSSRTRETHPIHTLFNLISQGA